LRGKIAGKSSGMVMIETQGVPQRWL